MINSQKFILKNISLSISPQKINLLADILRNKKLEYVMSILEFSNNKSGRLLYKIFQGINKQINIEEVKNFIIEKLEISYDATLKRIRYRARGNSSRIKKYRTLLNCIISNNNKK